MSAKNNKESFCRGEFSIKKFCRDLKEHAIEIVNHEKMEMIPPTKNLRVIFINFSKKSKSLLLFKKMP